MQNMNQRKNISGSISRALFVLLVLTLFGQVSAQEVSAQDTLRTFGPRFGFDLKTKMDALGIECTIHNDPKMEDDSKAREIAHALAGDFLAEKLKAKSE